MGATMIRATSRERSMLPHPCILAWQWMGIAGPTEYSVSMLRLLCGSLGGDMILGNR